ncbi:MAG: hypothetical protein LBL09_03625 [Oscillospiraceae bacterium]|jgi:hypothetical protein|nr:hypothetical protein [Oscillospiraceae bacterium]
MSIKGIDSQMMIARATDFVKESSNQLKKNELMQDYLAVQAKLESEHESNMVTRKTHLEQADMKLNKDGKGGGEYTGREKGKKGKPAEETEAAGGWVPGVEHKLDIKV